MITLTDHYSGLTVHVAIAHVLTIMNIPGDGTSLRLVGERDIRVRESSDCVLEMWQAERR